MTLIWHTLHADDVLKELKTAESGLSSDEAKRRLEEYGPNRLKEGKKISAWKLLLEQFQNILIIILFIGAALSAFLGHETEAITISVIVILAIMLGFVQEYRAERAIEALKKMSAPLAAVLRDGEEQEVDAAMLVPGDVVLLTSGDKVPADARLLEANALRVEESALTGESVPSEKESDVLPVADLPVGDRLNMVYAGTAVSIGRGKAVVTGTAMNTEFGKVAQMLQDVEEETTPLQENLDRVGKTLAKIALGVVVVISAIGFYRGQSIIEIFIFGIALAIAVVPEALPAVVTISLAIGVQKMSKRHALIRKLPAVETLGCTSVICSDKTGTLTKDEMTVRQIWIHHHVIDVTGTGYEPRGYFSRDGREIPAKDGLWELLKAGVLSSDARLIKTDEGYDIAGDPTEGALVVAAAKAGLFKEEVEKEHPRVGEIPFSSETKRMTTLHATAGKNARSQDQGHMAYAKGAPEVILPLCTRTWGENDEHPLTDKEREEILAAAKAMASQALRVLAIARRGGSSLESANEGMKFLGLMGMIDPPRAEARDAIAECKGAGIRVMMITGDHPVTAEAIARELGILDAESGLSGRGDSAGRKPAPQTEIVTGVELEAMSDAELDERIGNIAVFARVSPAHKLRLVGVLQKKGETVAMTGDGVNDAPALKKADIGVAMGITGTDVTKEAAAMTLTDDNFASIVAAVEEGRGIFGNIKKYLMYLLSSNVGEIIIVTVATILGWPLPLSAVQLLYLNLATDGFPALALAVDPPEKDLMRQPPRDPQSGIFSRRVIILMLTGSVWLAILILGIFWWATHSGRGLPEAMTMAFVLLTVTEFVKSYNFRSDHLSAFQGTFRNKWLNIAILWEIALLLCLVYVPFFQGPFGTVPLTLRDWGIIVACALTMTPVLELAKWILRRNGKI